MTFDEVARETCKAKVNKQALPAKYFPFYVAYKFDWWPETYLIGFECGFSAMALESEFKAMGRDTGLTTSYPFEIMNPEKKK